MTNCIIGRNCINCMLEGYCLHLQSRTVSKKDMANPAFVYDALAFAYRLNSKPKEFTLGVHLNGKPAKWNKFIHKGYTGYEGRFIGSDGKEEFLNTDDLFEVADEMMFDASIKTLANARKTLRDWLKDWVCTEPEPHNSVSFKGNTAERLRIIFTVLRATYPQETKFWGLRAANDNEPQK